MAPYSLALLTITVLALAFSCWLVFCTKSAVKFAQAHQTFARSKIASEPWYPLWLKFEGIWLWIMLAFFFSARLSG